MKTPGTDKISNEMILNTSDQAKESLVKLYNLSRKEKACPKEWKAAEL